MEAKKPNKIVSGLLDFPERSEIVDVLEWVFDEQTDVIKIGDIESVAMRPTTREGIQIKLLKEGLFIALAQFPDETYSIHVSDVNIKGLDIDVESISLGLGWLWVAVEYRRWNFQNRQ